MEGDVLPDREKLIASKHDLSGTELFGVDLSGADLSGANLVKARLTEADLRSQSQREPIWRGRPDPCQFVQCRPHRGQS